MYQFIRSCNTDILEAYTDVTSCYMVPSLPLVTVLPYKKHHEKCVGDGRCRRLKSHFHYKLAEPTE